MSQDTWNAVDRAITELFVGDDPALEEATAAARAAGLPAIEVSPPLGAMLHILARSVRARTVLEIGTLGGYSTTWLARALEPGGRLVTLEVDPHHAEVARANLERAGVAGSVEVRVGAALDSLPVLRDEGFGPVDVVFIDANKDGYADYFEWALALSRPGTLIIADNVVRGGAVVDPSTTDELVLGARRFNERVAREGRVVATEVQTVGSKGYDGFALVLVER